MAPRSYNQFAPIGRVGMNAGSRQMHYAILLGNQSLWEGFTLFTNQEILTHFKPFPQDKKMYPP